MRKKLDKPIELKGRVIEYQNTCHAAKSMPASGRMLSKSRRQTKKH